MADNKLYGSVLIKAAAILEVLAQAQQPMTLNEIALACGFTQSTVSKILTTLLAINYVQRHDEKKRYTLGSQLIYLANAAFLQFDIVRETYPALKFLHDQFHETVNLGVYQEGKILFLNKLSQPQTNHEMRSTIGYTQKPYCTAMGKAILATLPEQQLSEYLKEESFIACTPYTITTAAQLTEQLDKIRQRGYALDEREAEPHVFCVGASLQHGSIPSRYAFSISVPYKRLNKELQQAMIVAVIKTKTVLEYQLQDKLTL